MLLLDDYCYQSPSSIANQKLTIFLQLRFQKTVRLYSEQIMSVEKYPSRYLHQMEAIVYI